jgi:hypothetical protein
MAFTEAYGRPTARAARLNGATRCGPRNSEAYQKVVVAFVWIAVVSGSIALVEPSPYEFTCLLAIPIWAFGGFSVHRSFLLLYFLLVLQAIAGFLALLPYLSDTDAVLYQCQTAYLTVTALFFAAYVAERTQERAELILRGYTKSHGV